MKFESKILEFNYLTPIVFVSAITDIYQGVSVKILLMFLVVLFTSCSDSTGSSGENSSSSEIVSSSSVDSQWCNTVGNCGSFVDERDSKRYSTTTIGSQTWMAENLNYESDSISYCYNDIQANCDIFGRLYTWNIAMDGEISSNTSPSNVQGICPVGWHLPSDDEWESLAEYIVEKTGLDTKNDDDWTEIGVKIKSDSVWSKEGHGSDEFGFAGLPAGDRASDGSFYNIGNSGSWWSSTESFASDAYLRHLWYDHDYFYSYQLSKSIGYSVRCVKN